MSLLNSALHAVAKLFPNANPVARVQSSKERQDQPPLAIYNLRKKAHSFAMVSIVRKPTGEVIYELQSLEDCTKIKINRKLFEMLFEKESFHVL